MHWLMDAYRHEGALALWLKSEKGDERLRVPFHVRVAVKDTPAARSTLRFASFTQGEGKTTAGGSERVLWVEIPRLEDYEQFVHRLDSLLRHRVPLYNADIPPEQQYLYLHDLRPGCPVHFEGGQPKRAHEDAKPSLRSGQLKVLAETYTDEPVRAIIWDGKLYTGPEEELLRQFQRAFAETNPDIIIAERAFRTLPYLDSRLRKHHYTPAFHRFDPTPLHYRGGKSFFSYGQVRYQDFGVRLRGRILIDSTTMVGAAHIGTVLELSELSGARIQTVASRSFGAAFQAALVRELIQADILVPYKEKPVDKPLSLAELLAADRAGQLLDPKIGFHTAVAELDIISMYPFLIHKHNISAETILSSTADDPAAPGTTVRIKQGPEAIVPKAIAPFLQRRLLYKRFPTAENRLLAQGLKSVLVTSYGYLRFREFKLGIPASHMAIGAFARETLLASAATAQEQGFSVLHGIIDALYLTHPELDEQRTENLRLLLEKQTGLPISFEGIFAWIVFLPSIRDAKRPVPMRYYGKYRSGELKVRGIALRKRSTPLLVKEFQKKCLHEAAKHHTAPAIASAFRRCAKLIRKRLVSLAKAPAHELASTLRVSRERYRTNTVQARVLRQLRDQGMTVEPGQSVSFVWTSKGPVPISSYRSGVDRAKYELLLVRSLFEIAQPFGITETELRRIVSGQQTILTYANPLHAHTITLTNMPPERRGLSERVTKRHLRARGWQVFRAGSLHKITEPDVYPAVRAAYERVRNIVEHRAPGSFEELCLLSAVHQGMPDYVCVRGSEIRFVECKLENEQLSTRQQRTVERIRSLGLSVAVYTVISRRRRVSAVIGEHTVHVLERQQRLGLFTTDRVSSAGSRVLRART